MAEKVVLRRCERYGDPTRILLVKVNRKGFEPVCSRRVWRLARISHRVAQRGGEKSKLASTFMTDAESED